MPCEYVLKFHYLIPVIGLFLMSCQHRDEVKEGPAVKQLKLDEAASYNARLGLAYLGQGDRSRAKRKLLLALSQAPDAPNVNAAMAYFMEKSGEMKDANVYYQKAMAVSPKAGAQLNNYGAFLCRQGQYREAEHYFLKAVQDIKYDHTAGAYENAGLCVIAIPDKANAKKYFDKALEQDPSREQSLYELVNLEMKQGNTNEALAYLQKYPSLSLRHRGLLALAIDVTHKAGKPELEADYKTHLRSFSDNTGGKNEYDTDNG